MKFSYAKLRLILLVQLLAAATIRPSCSNYLSFIPNHSISKPYSYDSSVTITSRVSSTPTTIENTDSSTSHQIAAPQLISSSKTTRHPLFRNTNVNILSMPVPHPEIWLRCLDDMRSNDCCSEPQSLWGAVANTMKGHNRRHTMQHGITKDVEVIFEDASVGAQMLMDECGLITNQVDTNQSTQYLPEIFMKEQTKEHLTAVLSHYQSIVSSKDKSNLKRCKARVVSTTGSIGTKCPRWHADHVPVRLVMSIIGPGCECIPFEMEATAASDETIRVVNRHALNNLEDDDTSIANELIVPTDHLQLAKKLFNKDVITCAKPGDAVLLMGKGWEDESDDVLAAVHRSPILNEGEKRILLTVDVADWDYSHQ